MKLKPSTLLLVLTALLLGGVVLLVQTQAPPPSTQADEPQNLFAFKESEVQSLRLTTLLRSIKFERDSSSKWQMLEPEKAIASDPNIALLLSLVATGTSQRSFTAPASDREQYSFHQPLATIEVTLANKETHQLILGGYDFNRSSLYALVDPPTDPKADLKVLLVSPNFDNAVSRSLEDWKQTAEPAASPNASPSASPNESPSGSPSPAPIESPSGSPSPNESSPPTVSPAPSSESSATPSPDSP